MPAPRNDSVASVMMASARLMVAITSIGPIALGSTWRSMITGAGQPDQLRGRDIILVLLDHHRAAHGAGILHPETQADREHQHDQHAHGIEPVAEHRLGDAVDRAARSGWPGR